MHIGVIEQWRVLWWPVPSGRVPFLAGRAALADDPDTTRAIITSNLVSGDVAQGQAVRTRSGSVYTLGRPLPADQTPGEDVRELLQRRATTWAERLGLDPTDPVRVAEIEDLVGRILRGDDLATLSGRRN